MALTDLQRRILRLLADRRMAEGERYVAGGVALGELLGSPRLSRDVDLFHDTERAVAASWGADRRRLVEEGFEVEVVRERPGYVEAHVARGGTSVLVEWARDSAFRFFPLVEHELLGLALHPFDLATNKVLALVGRLEPRDWFDVLWVDDHLQPLGYLAWAAAGKDPGFGPGGILAAASRTGRYSQAEVEALEFAGDPPDAQSLGRRWREVLERAEDVIRRLPTDSVGRCVLSSSGELFTGTSAELDRAMAAGSLWFHPGSIGGALPVVKP